MNIYELRHIINSEIVDFNQLNAILQKYAHPRGKISQWLKNGDLKRVKGRDWYDFCWYVSRSVPVNLKHLQKRLIQSGHWMSDRELLHKDLIMLIQEKIKEINFDDAKKDVINFLKDRAAIELWSKPFFIEITQRLQSIK